MEYAVFLVALAALGLTAPVFLPRVGLSVRLLLYGYAAFGLLAALVFRPSADAGVLSDVGPNDYFVSLPSALIVAAIASFGICVFLGAVLVRSLSGSRGAQTGGIKLALALPPSTLWLPVLALMVSVVGVGFDTLLVSPAYLSYSGPAVLVKVGSALLPLSVVVCAIFVFDGSGGRIVRIASVGMLVLIELVQFSQSSRSFSLFFVLVFVGGWLTGVWSRRRQIFAGVAAIAVGILTIGIPLGLRGRAEHGLVPGLHYLFSSPADFFSASSNPIYNVFFGAPLTMYVWRVAPPISEHALWTSISPVPSGLTDWPQIAPTLRLNIYEPYSALGELLNHGVFVAMCFAVVLGAILELLTIAAGRARGMWSSGARALLVGVTALILVRSTQYNLRTVCRLVYLLLFAVLLMVVLSRITWRRKQAAGVARGSNIDPKAARAQAHEAGNDVKDLRVLPAGGSQSQVAL